MNARHVADTEAALAGTVAALDDGNAQIAALEDELVAARSTVDGWQNIAIQLAATCADLREALTAARWAGLTK
ncbi:hypothetical protein [Mycobacterium sp. 1245801.1]|uniref:hypothetical protein n=1 Tax=Mycobacterium sp. 1245801.1 TaxID=1834075 RepID=UPI0007FC6DC6|nr:hypothetical protein [Mycobacterium sp. 1245801.1]OBJ19024.1 hypothetical protein A5622_21230 [Mycobacterium sp. 1245801.1]OBJ21605.1 hypothetical protein A5622_17130 [Mycobacterium sp. 1245801.1]OBJ24615.1 hypothetical protein A5622_11605 [Mycobacterium sp. 1245801.1]